MGCQEWVVRKVFLVWVVEAGSEVTGERGLGVVFFCYDNRDCGSGKREFDDF